MHEAVTLSPEGLLEPIEGLWVATGDVVRLARWYDDFEVRIEERFVNYTQDWAVTAVSIDRRAVARSTEVGDALADVQGTVQPLARFDPHWLRGVSADHTGLHLGRQTRVRLVDQDGSVLLTPTELTGKPRFRLEPETPER
jgi:hypothetical protein